MTKHAKRNPARAADKPPLPTERAKLKLRLIRRRQEWGHARRSGQGVLKSAPVLFSLLQARLSTVLPLRAWQHYALQHGPLLSAGIGFTMFFSITGLLATGFALAGLVLSSNPVLVDSIIESVSRAAPGLLKLDGGEGLVEPEQLLNPSGLGLTAAIAAAVTVFTSLGWMSGVRDGLRGVLRLPALERNPVLLKLGDAATLLLLGVVLVLSAGVSLVFGTAAGWLIGLLRLDEAVAGPVAGIVKVAVPLLLNWATAAIMFRLAGGLKLGRRTFLEATALAGVGTTLLQVFSTELLARAGQNPVLAPFAIIIGLLIWFNLVSQVYLLAAAWAAIREADLGEAGPPAKSALGSRHVPPHAPADAKRRRGTARPTRR
ncbi:YihY/virulence factor BrkB family protein [Arthrobacter sp. CJ23]|uniref:YihY/virulence factor BrkB family protein n=1 Tax=Arthrobacter sp. CJ23 TaxID=2972479 RepID=UPI00215BEB85|nr:YihY/virulence factor BrkB family protein [Arthrobacter sp. CJ23]UVJ40636.1 YihY/virulence factor BrkB family protein [Arthrobacter sp. CJ23]